MDSLVIQLQRECLDAKFSTLDIMRKALVVAKKLGLAEFHKWVNKEIEGYKPGDDIPEYRVVTGQIKAWNPYRGWIDTVITNPELQESLSSRPIGQAIGELETVIERSEHPFVQVPFHPKVERELMKAGQVPLRSVLSVSIASTQGILQQVRKIVLDWSLELEAKGILGEGMTFSEKEKQAASDTSYHIHYHAPVTNSQIQQGTVSSSQTMTSQLDLAGLKGLLIELRSHVSKLRLSSERERQFVAELLSIEAQLSAPEPRRGVMDECFGSIRNILEGCAGSLIATGLLEQLARLWPH